MKTKVSVLGILLILSALVLSGCGGRSTPEPTETPSEPAVEVPEMVWAARDAALDFIFEQCGEQVYPAPGSDWLEENITPGWPDEPVVGWSEYRFTAGDLEVTVGYPIVAPDQTVHRVTVSNQATGFEWEGEVDAAGQVSEGSDTTESVTVPNPAIARDAAKAYVSVNYNLWPQDAPPPELKWVEEEAAEEGLVGSTTLRYTADDWVVTVSFPLVRPDLTIYRVFIENTATGLRWEGEIDAAGQATELSTTGSGLPVVAWYGYVVGTPEGAQYDDSLVLMPEGTGEIGVEGVDEAIEAEIVALRGKDEPGKYAHFWGILLSDVPDVGGYQLLVTRLDPGTPPGPRFDPDPVEGWEGQIFSVPGPAQFDDYFVLDGPFSIKYGIHTTDEAVKAALEDLRDTSAVIRLWGNIQCAIPDVCGCQIAVEHWELVSDESAPLGVHFESQVVGWYGRVVGLPADGRYDDYLHLLHEGIEVGLTGADAAIEREIEGLRDGTAAHFWGTITCGVPDYDGCQVTVTRIVPEGAGPYPDPETVEGWEGRYFSGRGLGGFDDCLILGFYGPFGVRYGIQGADETVQAALEDLREMNKLTDPPPDIRVWGEVRCGVSDVNGCQIVVDRLEELFDWP